MSSFHNGTDPVKGLSSDLLTVENSLRNESLDALLPKSSVQIFRPREGCKANLDAIQIESKRLRLSPVALSDTAEIFAAFTPQVTRFLLIEPPGRAEDTVAFLSRAIASRKELADISLTIRDRSSGEFLGCCGVHFQKRSVEPQLGIWLKESAQGKGLAKETITALCDWVWSNLDCPVLRYDCDRNNTASCRVAESLGGVVVGGAPCPKRNGGQLDGIFYQLHRPSFPPRN